MGERERRRRDDDNRQLAEVFPFPPVVPPTSASTSIGSPEYKYEAIVVEVVDGDTVDVDVLLGFYVVMRIRLRVWGINTPEVHTTNAEEKARGHAALAFAKTLLVVGARVLIKSFKANDPFDKFGRWLAVITLGDGRDFGQLMLDHGHALAYFGVGEKPI
jgi:endonuclease YncB( thermonuclease family)